MNGGRFLTGGVALLAPAPALAASVEAGGLLHPGVVVAIGLGVIGGACLMALVLGPDLRRRRRDLKALREATEALATDGTAELPAIADDDLAALASVVAALARSRDQAVAASQSRRQFLAAASHDLRQPLQALGLFVATLSQRDLGAKERAIVDKIESAQAALEHLLDTLLDISRLDAGTIKAHHTIFAVQPLFDRLAQEFVPLAEDKALAMRFVPTSAVIYSDPELLERILRNLLSNAIRYTERGGVVVGVRHRGDAMRLEVWDSGSGIPANRLGDIFREFSQLDNASRDRRRGLGLGLAIVERLAKLLGHDVDVVSVPGRGSVFRVTVTPTTGDGPMG